MSRVHDALRRAETFGTPQAPTATLPALGSMMSHQTTLAEPNVLHGLIEQIKEVPWDPNSEAHIIDHTRVTDAPAEEFRSLRTRLNHVQGLQPLRHRLPRESRLRRRIWRLFNLTCRATSLCCATSISAVPLRTTFFKLTGRPVSLSIFRAKPR